MLLPAASMLAALSMVMVARLEPSLAIRQAIWVGVGSAALLATLVILPSVSWLRQYRYTWAALGLVLVLSTFVFGVDPNGSGARLWLGFGGVYFQPSEILKILLVVFFAAYLDDYRELLTLSSVRVGPLSLPPLPYLAPLVFMLAIALGVVVMQRDLGAALLLFGLFLAMLFVATGRVTYVVGSLAIFMLGADLLYRLFSVVKIRVETWLDPWATATTTGYQLVQGLTALAAGGVLGTGLTFGYPDYVPAVHTDFMIAAIGEELGLVGSLGVVGLYVVLVHRGLRIAMLTGDSFATLLAAGLTSVLAIQALVILGGTLKLIPLTGVTLPLLSYGGSSVLANYVLLGLLLAVSAEPRRVPRCSVTWRGFSSCCSRASCSSALALGYWQFFRQDDLLNRPTNPRIAEEARRVVRGRILDRTGLPLAETVSTPGGVGERTYPVPGFGHLVGYHSDRFGNSGLEDRYDEYLRGSRSADPVERTIASLLHRPTVGSDVVLTVDARIQQSAVEVLGEAPGAVVVLDPKTGAILAMASAPTFDPGQIDEQWAALLADSSRPLVNRAIQSTYTPGSTFKVITAAAALDLEPGRSAGEVSVHRADPDRRAPGRLQESRAPAERRLP